MRPISPRPRRLLTAAALAILTAAPSVVLAHPPAVAAAQARVAASPFTHAEAERRADGSYLISWRARGATAVAVYASTSPDFAVQRKVGGGGAADSLQVAALDPAPRWYFKLAPDRGAPLVVADRSLHLATAPNFRDLGGLRTADGQWVAYGRIYRSDQLDRLSDADLETLKAFRVGLVADLRTEGERQSEPDRLPDGATALIADVLAGEDVPTGRALYSKEVLGQWLAGGPDQFAQMYRRFASGSAAQRAYHDLFMGLAAPRAGSSVFHCTAGKDRTGWAAAVLLSILGVPREAIIADYMASNRFLEAKNAAALQRAGAALDPATVERLKIVMVNRPEYIEAAFDEVDRRYGSMDRYVRDGLGLDQATLEALRAKLLVADPAALVPADGASLP